MATKLPLCPLIHLYIYIYVDDYNNGLCLLGLLVHKQYFRIEWFINSRIKFHEKYISRYDEPQDSVAYI